MRLQTMPIGELIDRFNESCGQPQCRYTSRQVNDDWCEQHRAIQRELQRRQRIFESPPYR